MNKNMVKQHSEKNRKKAKNSLFDNCEKIIKMSEKLTEIKMVNSQGTDTFKIPEEFGDPAVISKDNSGEPKVPNIRKIDLAFQKELNEIFEENVRKGKVEIKSESVKNEIVSESFDNISVVECVKKEIQKEIACDIAYLEIINMLVEHITKEGWSKQSGGQDAEQLKERIKNDLDELYSNSLERIEAIIRTFGILNFTQEQIKKIPFSLLQDFFTKEMKSFFATCLSDDYCQKITKEQYAQLRKLLDFIGKVTVEHKIPTSHEEIMEFRRSIAKLLQPCFEFMPPHILAKLPEDINFYTAMAKIGAQEMQNPDWIGVVSVSSHNDFRVSRKPFTLANKVKIQKEHDTDKFLRGGYRIIQKEVENS